MPELICIMETWSQIKKELNGSVSICVHLERLTIKKALEKRNENLNQIRIKTGNCVVTSDQICNHFTLWALRFANYFKMIVNIFILKYLLKKFRVLHAEYMALYMCEIISRRKSSFRLFFFLTKVQPSQCMKISIPNSQKLHDIFATGQSGKSVLPRHMSKEALSALVSLIHPFATTPSTDWVPTKYPV